MCESCVPLCLTCHRRCVTLQRNANEVTTRLKSAALCVPPDCSNCGPCSSSSAAAQWKPRTVRLWPTPQPWHWQRQSLTQPHVTLGSAFAALPWVTVSRLPDHEGSGDTHCRPSHSLTLHLHPRRPHHHRCSLTSDDHPAAGIPLTAMSSSSASSLSSSLTGFYTAHPNVITAAVAATAVVSRYYCCRLRSVPLRRLLSALQRHHPIHRAAGRAVATSRALRSRRSSCCSCATCLHVRRRATRSRCWL